VELGELQRADVVTLVTNALRARGLCVGERELERIIVRSQRNPFVVFLMAQALAEGTSLEELERPAELKYLVIRRLVTSGVPEEVFRALISRLLKART
jgi:hypothetical protein